MESDHRRLRVWWVARHGGPTTSGGMARPDIGDLSVVAAVSDVNPVIVSHSTNPTGCSGPRRRSTPYLRSPPRSGRPRRRRPVRHTLFAACCGHPRRNRPGAAFVDQNCLGLDRGSYQALSLRSAWLRSAGLRLARCPFRAPHGDMRWDRGGGLTSSGFTTRPTRRSRSLPGTEWFGT